jgi:ElaB/YqjD/DUF883 family membrane-anchored ribosome-binding protein
MALGAERLDSGRRQQARRWFQRLRSRGKRRASGRRQDQRVVTDIVSTAAQLMAPRTFNPRLHERPLTIAGATAGVGLLLAAALAYRRKHSEISDPEEIVARALCREDPDTPTHRGPLWTGYRGDARRVLSCLRAAGLVLQKSA